MPIMDRSKIRPDVLKMVDELQKVQLEGIGEFLQLKENQGLDFQALWKKVMHGNALFFENKGVAEALSGLVTREEMLFLARMHRFTSDYVAHIKQKKYPVPEDVKIEATDAGGIPVEWQIVPAAKEDQVLLYLHGGGWVLGSPNSYRLLTIELGRATGMRVLNVDYRLAPEHPYPAQLEDCTSAYKWLLSKGIKPENIIIAGDSAGGSLTLTSILKLRDDGTPLPAGAVCLSPSTEIGLTDDSYFKNGETDPILADIGLFWWIQAYLAGADPSDPFLSPLLGDLKGLPPLLFQVSTCEMLYCDSTRFVDKARAAGVDVTLETWDDMLHVFHFFGLHQLSEAKEAIAQAGEFVQRLSG
ncbi:MAG: alpha/beta hydrolase [Desulfobacteraceae bacterium]|nr:alpha/beta hydrolase [Desulfobacteraceae bacterium]